MLPTCLLPQPRLLPRSSRSRLSSLSSSSCSSPLHLSAERWVRWATSSRSRACSGRPPGSACWASSLVCLLCAQVAVCLWYTHTLVGITSFLVIRMWFGKAVEDFNRAIFKEGSDAPQLIAYTSNGFVSECTTLGAPIVYACLTSSLQWSGSASHSTLCLSFAPWRSFTSLLARREEVPDDRRSNAIHESWTLIRELQVQLPFICIVVYSDTVRS